MPSINLIHTILPQHRVDLEDLPRIAEEWLSDDVVRERFLRLAANAGVRTRYFALPYRELLQIPGLRQRRVMFEELGTELLSRAVSSALEKSGRPREEFGHFIYTSCSIPSIPSPDAQVILQSGLPSTIGRVPMFQQGCAGGVVSLGLGAQLARNGTPVIAASLELCSLVFQPKNLAGEQLVGAAIFADGAAAAVISPDEGILNIVSSQSFLIPETNGLMGYDIFDDGFHLRLDRGLPSALAHQAPRIVADFLRKNGLGLDDIRYWLFHPGGRRILESLQESFNLDDAQFHWSCDVLRDTGNLSSATIYFVLQRFLEERPFRSGEYALVVGIGPGLTVELVLLACSDPAR